MRKLILIIGFILALALLGACATQATPEVVTETVVVEQTVVVEKEVEVVVTEEVVVEKEVEVVVEVVPTPAPYSEIPHYEEWADSPHNAAEDEAFTHWDEDDPQEVPESCAKCHSTAGYHDFLGEDGSEPGVVNAPAPIGITVTCVACHNKSAKMHTSVVFPSGMEITDLGAEARCMECHQGRASTVAVNDKIEAAGLTDMDAVSEDLGFTNIHYYAAAATQAGNEAMGGYQYDGKSYDSRYTHAAGVETCQGCHNPHTLDLRVDGCATCHEGVESAEDFRDVRMRGSLVDYDGDGDLTEGIYYEVEGLRDMLYGAMQTYAEEVVGAPIAYESHTYPYFFADTNGNGQADEDEANYGNSFKSWTGRLSKAAYNYQASLKDPGSYVHNGKYTIQFLYDSIEDLNEALPTPVDLSNAHRIDHGHFAGSEEAFRHWDEDGEVSASCSKCHTGTGLPLFLKEGVTVSMPPTNGLACETCHDSLEAGNTTLYEVASVEFPSGAVIDGEAADASSLLCLNCHQGRASGDTVTQAVDGLAEDEVSDSLRFINVHYFVAGATRYGSEVNGMYEYPDKEYVGYFAHDVGVEGCTECHSAHKLEVNPDTCADCHSIVTDAESLQNIRKKDAPDYDGDGDNTTGLAVEVANMTEALYAAMQDYAVENAGTAVLYESHSYPYFFNDSNGNGELDEEEVDRANAFSSWTPRLLKAAYNYQYAQKDPGAFAHNGMYALQTLYDGIEDLGGDTTGLTRP